MKIFNPEEIAALCDEYSKFVPFLGTEIKFPDPSTEFGKARIAEGERFLNYEPTVLPLSSYRRFVEDGDRVEYETPYFMRREALANLVLAELTENKGRFTRKICDILWCILEETTWVIPAHYKQASGWSTSFVKIPFDHERVVNIDLFSAGTGGLVSLVYYFMKDKFEAEAPGLINSRILYELKRRIIEPYKANTDYFWRGYSRADVNNWCPWITSNILTTAAIVCEDIEERRYFLREAMVSLNAFVDTYGEDGGCDEGPGYWTAAGACLFDTLEMVYDMTCGKTDELFKLPLVVNICDYVRKTRISGEYVFNCADCHPKSVMSYLYAKYIERMGERVGYDLLYAYGNTREVSMDPRYVAKCAEGSSSALPYRCFRNNILCEKDRGEYTPELLELLPDLQFLAMRSERSEDSGMYLGIKGGHNAESHNHNDVGNYVLYYDGKPIIIDIGVGTYTKFTFNEMRYKMHFNFRSEGHNLPVICGLTQEDGRKHASSFFNFDKDAMTLKVGLESAYHDTEGVIRSYTRSASLCGETAEITDEILLSHDGEAQFMYYTPEKPEIIGGSVRLCDKITLELSESSGIEIEEIVFDDEILVRDWAKSIWKIVVSARSNEGKITMRSKFYKDLGVK